MVCWYTRGALGCTVHSRLCGWSYLIKFFIRNFSQSFCSEPSPTVLLLDVCNVHNVRQPPVLAQFSPLGRSILCIIPPWLVYCSKNSAENLAGSCQYLRPQHGIDSYQHGLLYTLLNNVLAYQSTQLYASVGFKKKVININNNGLSVSHIIPIYKLYPDRQC